MFELLKSLIIIPRPATLNRFLIIFLVLVGCRAEEEGAELRAITTIQFESNVLEEKRKIFISLPKNELTDKLGKKKFPVIYVLDGETMFDYVVGMVNFLSLAKGNDVLPQSIIVGIPNTNRTRDLTPNPVPGDGKSGGGKVFASFLEKELIPYIDENYPTLHYKTIIGHSFGGLFAIYVLYNHPELFNNYIALDPSFQYLNKQENDFNDLRYQGKQLFVGIANTIGLGLDTSDYDLDANTRHFDELMQWSRKMEQHSGTKLKTWSRYYENDDHASLCVEATYDALRIMFSWYHIDLLALRQDPAKTKPIKKIIEDHYQLISAKYNETVLPDEEFVNRVAWLNLSSDRETVKELLTMNLLNYPESFNANFALGNFYRIAGKSDSAKIYLKTALKIKDDLKAAALLEKIQ